jgi:four helix bundle protein
MAAGYENLKVWQKAMDLVEVIYKLTEGFSGRGHASLIDQMRRAAVSVPSNIAEGSMRKTTREYLRFISISQGSLAELETQIMITHRLTLLDTHSYQSAIDIAREVGKMMTGLYNALEAKMYTSVSSSLATSSSN